MASYRKIGKKYYLVSNSGKVSRNYTKDGKFINAPKTIKGEYIINGQGYSIADKELDNVLKKMPQRQLLMSYDKTAYRRVGNQLLLKNPTPNTKNTYYVVTNQTAPLVNPRQIFKFRKELRAKISLINSNKNRLIRPLFPVNIKKLGKRIDLLNRAETLQRKLETAEIRAYAREKKPLKSLGRQTAIFGLSFGTEFIKGAKGMIALPKNLIKLIPQSPKLITNLIRDRKNIIPMAKLRFKTFRETQGYLFRTSPATFWGKIGANIYLFKATGTGLKIAGKVTKPAYSKILKYLPKRPENVIFKGWTSVRKGNKIYSFVNFESKKKILGKKIYGMAYAESTIGKTGKLVLNEVRGKAFKLKPFRYLRKSPINTKKMVSFLSSDTGGTTAKNYLKIGKFKKGAVLLEKDLIEFTGKGKKYFPTIKLGKGITINQAIRNYIQINVGTSLQSASKTFFNIVRKGGQIKRITSKPLTLRTFLSQSRIFTKEDLSYIIGRTKTNLREIIQFKGLIKTIKVKDGVNFIVTGGKNKAVTLTKQNMVNLASALSVGQVGAKKILNKLSPTAQRIVTNNIKAGLVLIPKIDFKNIKAGVPSVSASITTSLSRVSNKSRQVNRHIDSFQRVTSLVTITGTKSISRQKTIPKQQERFIEVLKSPSAQRGIQKLTPRQTTKLKEYLRQYLRQYPSMRVPIVRVIPFSFIAKSKEKIRRGGATGGYKAGFIVYGLNKGAYMRLNRLPLLKQDALSRGAYAVDRTTSKTFKLIPVPNVTKFGRIIKREKGYFTLTKQKFREYKIIKGQKKILTYTLIEKRKYGIDTPGEKKGLSLYRYLARLKKSGKY